LASLSLCAFILLGHASKHLLLSITHIRKSNSDKIGF
jgi:hypothetical protein